MATAKLQPEDWAEVSTIFSQAIEVPAEQRRALVEQCRSGLKDTLKDLLARFEQSTAFMRSGVLSHERLLEHLAAGSHALSVGDTVANRFLITRFIAEGGMGEVYEAEDRELAETVALKTIRPSLAVTPESLALFKSEIHLSRRVTHPNVCRVFDVFWHVCEDGCTVVFLSMELVRGKTLADYLSELGPLDWQIASELIEQITAALATAHKLGIVHRDLKPKNIMLEEAVQGKWRAVITDFGLALSVASPADPRVRGAGTPAYMAPEQASGDELSPATDIYALGLIICDMLTGDHPKLSRVSPAESARQLSRWLNAHSKLPKRLKRLVSRCLQFRPEDRFATVAEMASLLHAARRKRAALIAAAVFASTTVAIVAAIWSSSADAVIDSTQLTPDNVVSAESALSRDGKYVVYSSNRTDRGNKDIWFQRLPAGEPRRLTSDHGENSDPSVSPDGSLVMFRSERNGGGIYSVRTDGSGETLVIPGGRYPSFSSDGRSISYWMGSEEFPASGQLFLYALGAGKPRRLAPEFTDVRPATWSPDSSLLVFFGCQQKQSERNSDFWILDPERGQPVPTGAGELIRARKIVLEFPPRAILYDQHLVFAAREGQRYQLWSVGVSKRDLRASLPIRKLESPDLDAMAPAITEDGTMARDHVSGMINIWRLPLTAAPDEMRPIKVTDGLAQEGNPAVTAGERWLFFTRSVGSHREILKLDLASERQSLLYRSEDDAYWPLPDSRGATVAFESDRANTHSIVVLDAKGVRTICSDCSRPATWLSNDELLASDNDGSLSVFNLSTGSRRVLISPQPGVTLSDADWNPSRGYLLFTATTGDATRLFAAQYSKALGRIEGPWLPLTSESEGASRPRWSRDGSAFYYLSHRDGFNCVWKRSFSPGTHVAGEATAVKHYHDRGAGPDLAFPSWVNLSVGENSLYLSIAEVSSAVWLGRIRWNFLPLLHRFDKPKVLE